ncbi:MAG: class II aldolase/adducin family protein [Caldithrix sp.]|nr:class II aldolase/adducin family protein [Caldithrix sp.]
MANVIHIKKQMVHVGQRMYERGMVAANDGNISVRLDDDRILITPSGISKGFMQPDDIVATDKDGYPLDRQKKPSSEIQMHVQIYAGRPDVYAVCHAHPIYATAFAVAGLPLDQCVLPEVIIALGGAPIVAYGTPGTKAFYEPVARAMLHNEALLLQNHGAVSVGDRILTAYHRMETLEHAAHIIFLSRQLGGPHVLEASKVQELEEQRQKFKLQTRGNCQTYDESTATDEKEHNRQKIVEEVVKKIKTNQ